LITRYPPITIEKDAAAIPGPAPFASLYKKDPAGYLFYPRPFPQKHFPNQSQNQHLSVFRVKYPNVNFFECKLWCSKKDFHSTAYSKTELEIANV